MFTQILIVLLGVAGLAGILMTCVGVLALLQHRRARSRGTAPPPPQVGVDAASEFAVAAATDKEPDPKAVATVTLDGKGTYPAEPGVLLNTLWEHLPNAECQEGECGGCKMQLLEGQVTWIRDPIVDIDRRTYFLACSCEAAGPIRCAAI